MSAPPSRRPPNRRDPNRRAPNRRAEEQARLAAEQASARRRERRILVVALVAFVLLLVGGGIGFQAWRTNRTPTAAPAALPVASAPATISNARPIVWGSAEAPVTLSLYEDFHCPHCAEFEEQFAGVLNKAQQSGQVRVELYPMAFIDEGSTAAANGMACAAEAGFGPSYFAGLFANHTLQWSDDQLIELARVSGAEATPAFTTCVTSKAHAGWVESINTAADQRGVTGTPTLFLDDKAVDVTGLTPTGLETMIAEAAQK